MAFTQSLSDFFLDFFLALDEDFLAAEYAPAFFAWDFPFEPEVLGLPAADFFAVLADLSTFDVLVVPEAPVFLFFCPDPFAIFLIMPATPAAAPSGPQRPPGGGGDRAKARRGA